MKKISRVFICAVSSIALFAIASCSEKSSPIEKALRDQIICDNPEITGLNLSEVKVEEKVTFGAELEHSFKIFRAKEKMERGRFEKYSEEAKPATAALHLKKAETSARILEALEGYKKAHASSLDSIVYYVVSFKMSYNKADRTPVKKLSSITTDMRVCNIVDASRSAKIGMSSTMPGYSALLDSCAPAQEQEEDASSEDEQMVE